MFTICILASDGQVKMSASGEQLFHFVYPHCYEKGDQICLLGDTPGYVVAQLEDSIPPVFAWLDGRYTLTVPFEEKRICYSPKSFYGDMHLLSVRPATDAEIHMRRNLALNPLDSHENLALFPHALANVETRGESVFAARNAIDGYCANHYHGSWPFQSWGINRDPEAALTVTFGREVTIDEVVLTLRADFPHDNWWKQVTVCFSDGSREVLYPQKLALPQAFPISPRTVRWATLCELIPDETDPSPFPALTQVEFWGNSL